MHVEDYINTVGKQHRNENQNFEFRSISTLREFIEGAIKNCTIPDVIKSVCDKCEGTGYLRRIKARCYKCHGTGEI